VGGWGDIDHWLPFALYRSISADVRRHPQLILIKFTSQLLSSEVNLNENVVCDNNALPFPFCVPESALEPVP